MGILDFLGGLGKAGAAPWTQRLTSGLGQQGGMLQHLGMGKYGTPGMGSQLGQGASFTDFLHNLGGQLGGPPASDMGYQQQPPQQGQGTQPQGLGELIAQWMKLNQPNQGQ